MLEKVGITECGKYVIGGIYQYKATHGLPLDIICEDLKSKGFVPSFFHYYVDGMKQGANSRALLTEIEHIRPGFSDMLAEKLGLT